MAKLKQELGLFDVYAIATGATLSSGFFLLPGIAASEAGGMLPLSYLLAGICLVPGLLSMAELSTAMPRAGGIYYFLDRSMGPLVGTVGGFGTWSTLTLKVAFALVGLGAYLGLYFPDAPAVPITLAVIMLEVGRRIGLPLQGVGAPFHFLVKYEDERGPHYLDPFHAGRSVDHEQLAARMRQTNPAAGPSAEAFLSAVTKRQILQRILTNLKGACVRKRQFGEALETSEFLLALAPWSLEERRDRGLLHFEVGRYANALEDLELYQQHAPGRPDAARVAAILQRVRGRLEADEGGPPGL